METPFDRHSYRVYAPHSSTNCGDSISISLDAVSSRDPRGIGNWFGFYVISMEVFFFFGLLVCRGIPCESSKEILVTFDLIECI